MNSKYFPTLLLSSLIFTFSFSTFGQVYPGIKKGEIEILQGTTYLLVKHKKKTGLYDKQSKKYIIEPEKSFFHYSDSYNYLFRLDKKGIVSAYDLNMEAEKCLMTQNQSELLLNKMHFNDLCIIPPHDTSIIASIPEEMICESPNATPTSGLRLIDNSLLIYNYMPLFRDPVAMPIKSELNTEEDSLIYDEKTGFYNAVYPPDQPAIRTSGVQSTKTGEWQIKPKYENIYFENNLFICLFHAEDGMNEIAYYDIYKKNGDQIVPTEYMGIKSNRELPKNLFSDSELIFDRDSTFYYIKSAEGMGLKSLYLFDSECNSDYTVTIPDFLHFSNETIFEPRYEFAHKIGNDYSYLAAYGDNGFEFIKRSWGQVPKDFNKFPIPIRESIKIYRDVEIFLDYIVIDDITYLDTCVGEVCLQKIDRSYFFSDNHLGLEKIGDSLIYLKYHIPELIDQYTMPYIEDMWGEDSIAYNPETGHYETVYPPNDPGVYESGIFDLKTQK